MGENFWTLRTCDLFSGRVFNGSAVRQDVGIDISNVKFFLFVVSGCTTFDVLLGTNSSNMLFDYYRFRVLAALVLA